MADKKISQLQAATLPLAGTELLPIVQSGTTDNITVNNLAAGNIKSNATTGVLQVIGPAAASTRVMTTPDANFTAARTDAAQSFTADQTLSTGNLVIGTSGKGIDFSATANSGGTMTSELLADYEEGTWTIGIAGGTTAGTYGTSNSGRYTKVGNMVTVEGSFVDIPVTSAGSGDWLITGLPYTIANTLAESRAPLGCLNVRQLGTAVSTAKTIFVQGVANGTSAYLMYFDGTNNAAIPVTNISSGTTDIGFTMTYFV